MVCLHRYLESTLYELYYLKVLFKLVNSYQGYARKQRTFFYETRCSGRYILGTKLNSTRSTLSKVDKVERVALAAYTLATTLNVYGISRLCCRFVVGFGNSRLSAKSTVLSSTLSPVLFIICSNYRAYCLARTHSRLLATAKSHQSTLISEIGLCNK